MIARSVFVTIVAPALWFEFDAVWLTTAAVQSNLKDGDKKVR